MRRLDTAGPARRMRIPPPPPIMPTYRRPELRRGLPHLSPPLVDPALAFVPSRLMSRLEKRRAGLCARAAGVASDEAALAEGFISQRAYYRALADHLGLPFLDESFEVAETALTLQGLRARIAPVSGGGRIRFALAPSGAALQALLAGGRKLAGAAITTPANLDASVRRAGGALIAQIASDRLPRRAPGLSARTSGGRVTALILAVACVVIAGLLTGGFDAAGSAHSFMALVFVPGILLRLFAFMQGDIAPVAPAVAVRDLPRWSIIVAMYREELVVERLVEVLGALDYPAAKLDVKLVVEVDDAATQGVLARMTLPPNFEVVVCPDGFPRTKPRALNAALALCRGEFVTVYDAEDEPEADQLRIAAAAFAAGPSDLACVQARLAIDNGEDNRLARLFALEYAALFDRCVPGYARLGLPVPLGGTSNHFRRRHLEKALGWDAWNVAEDADLGLRLARLGLRVGTVDSDTWEEAPNTVFAWLRQRSRWMKGWMQTGIVHLRAPRALVRRVGALHAGVIAVHTLGAVIAALFAPLMMFTLLRAAAVAVTGGTIGGGLAPLPCAVMLAGFVALTLPMAVAARRRGLGFGAGDLAALPVYLLLISAASWIALFELVRAPSSWAKTEHGTARRRERGVAPVSG